jgi:hypothetical protein
VKAVSIDEVKAFWDKNPLCASAIPYPLGSAEYSEYYNALCKNGCCGLWAA